MPRLVVQLKAEQVRRLREAAAAAGVSMAELVRRAVDVYLALYPDRFERAIRAAGAFAGDAPDVSRNHDRYLEDAFRA